jgi:hypothetical protein
MPTTLMSLQLQQRDVRKEKKERFLKIFEKKLAVTVL